MSLCVCVCFQIPFTASSYFLSLSLFSVIPVEIVGAFCKFVIVIVIDNRHSRGQKCINNGYTVTFNRHYYDDDDDDVEEEVIKALTI